MLAYLARYTHRVAIANSRLVELTNEHVRFRWKDYRANGRSKSKVMALAVGEFMRRFLLHVLPDGFHRIRHYGLFANGHRADNLALLPNGYMSQMPVRRMPIAIGDRSIQSYVQPTRRLSVLRRPDEDRRKLRRRLFSRRVQARRVRQLMTHGAHRHL